MRRVAKAEQKFQQRKARHEAAIAKDQEERDGVLRAAVRDWGLTLAAIADTIGVTAARVHQLVNATGDGYESTAVSDRREQRRQKIAEMYRKDCSYKEIAAALDSTVGSINAEVNRMRASGWDLPRRTRRRTPAPGDGIAVFMDALERNAQPILDATLRARDACPRCDHSAAAHSNAREDDYQCDISGCTCPGWLPSERPTGRPSPGGKPAHASKPRPKGTKKR